MIGLEGGHTLGGSLGVLRIYYDLGVRYMTLTSSTCHTTWADSHNADAPKYDVKHGGLTQYGRVSNDILNNIKKKKNLCLIKMSCLTSLLSSLSKQKVFYRRIDR